MILKEIYHKGWSVAGRSMPINKMLLGFAVWVGAIGMKFVLRFWKFEVFRGK